MKAVPIRVIIPGMVTVGMLLLPWLDRSDSRHPAKRRWIIDMALALILLIGVLTLKGLLLNVCVLYVLRKSACSLRYLREITLREITLREIATKKIPNPGLDQNSG